jgi:type 1 fimbria pilin
MKQMRTLLALATMLSLAWAPALLAADAAVKGEWTGYVTDGHCGVKGANKDHTAACVEKCIKSGTKVQIWIEADNRGINLDSFAKVKDLVGSKVTVKGTLDPATHTITVDSAEKATK